MKVVKTFGSVQIVKKAENEIDWLDGWVHLEVVQRVKYIYNVRNV